MKKKTEVQTKNKKIKKSLTEQAKQFWDDIWNIEKEFNKISSIFINALKVITVSAHKFLKDDCLSRASAIAYTTIVSLIPMLTVGFSLFSAYGGLGNKKEQIIKIAEQYIKEHNLNIDISPFTNAIIGLTDNAAGIGGIGLLVLIFSATAVLRTLEKTFNTIWKVQVQRSVMMKVIYYWAALTLGPLLLAIGGSMAGIMANIFTMPTIHDTAVVQNKIWLIGDRGLITQTNANMKQQASLDFTKIDLDNQKIYIIHSSIEARDIAPIAEENKSTASLSLKDLTKAQYNAIHHHGQNLWITSENGSVLFSNDNGKRWNIIRFGKINLTGTFGGLQIQDIHFEDSKNGWLIARNGIILKTSDSGKNWTQILPEINNPLINLQHFDLNKIFFANNQGYILGDKGTIITSMDNGATWQFQQIPLAKIRNKYVALHDISINAQGEMWLTGAKGLILYSTTQGKQWLKRNRANQDYYSIIALGPKQAIVSGQDGYLLHTIDSGERWTREKHSGWSFYSLAQYNNQIFAFGENFSAYKTKAITNLANAQWQKVMGGKSFWYSLINFLAPFAVIWLLFIVAYITLPNTKVPYKPAAIGASVTSAVWVIFILSFMFYVKNLTGGTQAIYGALAIIPIFLLMIYASAVITLFGAEITYTLHHPSSYASKTFFQKKNTEEIYLFDAINILFHIYRNYELGKGTTQDKQLRHLMNANQEEYGNVMLTFEENGYIKFMDEHDIYVPLKAAKLINLDEITNLMLQRSFFVPKFSSKHTLKNEIQKHFTEIESFRHQKLKNITMQNLIDRHSMNTESIKETIAPEDLHTMDEENNEKNNKEGNEENKNDEKLDKIKATAKKQDHA